MLFALKSTAVKIQFGNRKAKAKHKLPDPEPKSTMCHFRFLVEDAMVVGDVASMANKERSTKTKLSVWARFRTARVVSP
jgi:hypothetical protein